MNTKRALIIVGILAAAFVAWWIADGIEYDRDLEADRQHEMKLTENIANRKTIERSTRP